VPLLGRLLADVLLAGTSSAPVGLPNRTSGGAEREPQVIGCRMTRFVVGVAGFEPAASSSRTKRAAKLRYTPPARNLTGAARDFDSLAETRTRSRTAAHRTGRAGAEPGRTSRSPAVPG
jgi:hypothetical protein